MVRSVPPCLVGRDTAFSDKIGDNTGVTFGTPLTVLNEKLDRIIARLEAEESKDDGEKK
jgi:hypothetical protein